MNLFKKIKSAAGLEVFDKGLRGGLFLQKDNLCSLERGASLSLSEEILKTSFKTENILDPDGFKDAVKKILGTCHFKGGRLGVSLPHATVKLRLHSFQELPGDIRESNELVKWTATRNLAVSPHDIKISWSPMGKDGQGRHVLLVAMISKSVLTQYRKEIQSIGAIPVGFGPTALNRFNFYASALPMDGSFLYLEVSKWVVTLAGFKQGSPLFFKTFRKGFLYGGIDRQTHDVSLMLDHCLMNCAEIQFSRIFLVFQGGKIVNIQTLLREKSFSHLTILNPLDFINPGTDFADNKKVGLFTASAATALAQI
ncbi:hypothetical protein SAMN02746065_10366 [Desulfocicer vacuolatum DSM 3385]|uniref:Tfp pilus assembly protein, ATPase PilM n=1 Tax=Desulfocicer vacuolatum DSM 3385 TaxID=1121400 RepID=A0A1W1ZNV2_9BACT|nr:hypothetical protein [Desulfocicer vacuolatum]SMC50054.1 hypothetical protein SAMN02746065_10366 [Desulfocicer vacuolatum DSM 3385]